MQLLIKLIEVTSVVLGKLHGGWALWHSRAAWDAHIPDWSAWD